MASQQLVVPAHIAARNAARQAAGTKSALASAILGDGGFSFPKISIRAGRYRLVEDGVETVVGVTLDVIIVGANPRVSKIFYAQAYDGNAEGVRPSCFSNDGIRPDASVTSPINASCADCPNNVLGSKMLPSGQKSKLCADQRHLAVVPAADPNKVYALTITVSAMKSLREYFKELNNYGVNPEEAITELSFDESASYPKVVFKHKGYVPEKAMARIDALTASEDVKVAVRLAAPSGAPQIAAPTAPVQMQLPLEEPAQEALTPAATPAAKAPAKEKSKPVNATAAELEAKLDSLFA